jgi:hypothetical protein
MALPNALSIYNFPDTYDSLVDAFTGTIKYISASTGSNSNTGNSVGTAYLTIDYALAQNTSATATMFVILEGTYTLTPTSINGSSVGLNDGGNHREFVCAPGRVIIQHTASGADRDSAIFHFANINSKIYGAIIKRNNNARTTNYTVAYFRFGSAKGNFYNCVFSETNANTAWSYQYDNYGTNNLALRNCTIYNLAAPSGNYTNAGTCLTVDSVFNTTVTTGGTETNVLKSQTVSASNYSVSGVTTAGVYSGTYAWNSAITLPQTTPITVSSYTVATATSASPYTIYTFNSSGSITFGTAGYIDYLVVAGGGGGGWLGGGGAGGFLTAVTSITATAYTVTVGSGGSGGGTSASAGGNGTDSIFGTITSTGGGGGGSYNGPGPGTGGSGGGGFGTGAAGNTPSTIPSQGNTGGNGSSNNSGGGGGGASIVGQNAPSINQGGNGGAGTLSSISGSDTYYAGGGGGYTGSGTTTTGGAGGGGAGGNFNVAGAVIGTPNTGGGGGGGGYTGNPGKAGGTGIVILKVFTGYSPGLYANPTSVASGSSTVITLVTSGLTDGTTVAYTITGVTSTQLNNTSLTGNFTVTSNTATLTIPTSNSIVFATMIVTTSLYNISIPITFTTTIATANISNITFGTSSTSFSASPIPGQMNIADTILTLALPEWNSSSTSLYNIPGQMNISKTSLSVADSGTISSGMFIIPTVNKANAMGIPTVTTTTNTASVLNQYTVKPFGDNPQRERWV